MRASSAKAKGRRACKEVKDLLLEYARELESDDIQITGAGATGEDLMLSPLARKVYPISIECKNQEALNIWSALKQAEGHSDKYPGVVFFRRNRSKLYVAMEAEEFIKLVRRHRDSS